MAGEVCAFARRGAVVGIVVALFVGFQDRLGALALVDLLDRIVLEAGQAVLRVRSGGAGT